MAAIAEIEMWSQRRVDRTMRQSWARGQGLDCMDRQVFEREVSIKDDGVAAAR
jgi:hypothetical protein